MTGAYTFKRFSPPAGKTHWDVPKGHWSSFEGTTQGKEGKTLRILICCPECGTTGMLPHRIDEKGGVHPSILCSTKGCTFHTQPNTLEGWDLGERPDTKED